MKKFIFILLCFILCGCSQGVSEEDYQKALQEANEYREMYEQLRSEQGNTTTLEEITTISTPTPTPKPTATPTPTIVPYANKDSYSTDLTYETLARYPDKYKFERVCFKGKITQIIEANFLGEVTMRMNVDNDSDKNLYVVFDEDLLDFNLLVGDEITIYGEFKGLYSYTTVLGSSLSVPKVSAYIVELEEKEPEVVPTADDIEILKEYVMHNSWYSYHFMVIKNNGQSTIEVSTSTIAYSSDGNVIGLKESNVEALGSGCETVIYENFDYNENIDYFETEFSVSKEEYYDSVIQNLTYEKISIEDGAIFKVTNNGDYEAEFVEGYALFFKDGNLVDYDSAYFTDDDSEIKAGKTISKQLDTYKEFDSIEFYLQGRYNDW